jgi:nicotinate dehydrogenase subunit B
LSARVSPPHGNARGVVHDPARSGASRRQFLQQGAAVTVAFTLAPLLSPSAQAEALPSSALPGSLQNNRALDGWLRINANGTVTVFTGKVELGQGIVTALAQIVADELDVELKRIEMISGDTSRTPNEGFTSGSRSIEESGTALRYAAAEARAILLGTAAAKLGADLAALRVEDGTVIGPGNARTTYWQVTTEGMLKREATAKVKPKPAAQHRIIGQEIPRRDIPAKVTGGVAYVQDMRLPQMLFGRVVRPPSAGARLLSVDEGGARGLPGVVALLRDGSFLAIAAEREEQAIAAARALQNSAKWQEAAELPPSGPKLFEYMKTMRSKDSVVAEKAGTGVAAGAKTLEVQYTRPYQAHASIGPSCAVASWRDGKMQVWTHSQGVFPLRVDLAKALKMPAADITVMHREGAGCYGHNGADDVALDAALLARATGGRPVKVQWMREDEFLWEPYGSAMAVRLRAALDANGRVVDWQHEIWSHAHTTRPGEPEGVNLLAAWYLKEPFAPAPPHHIPQPAGGGDRNSIPLYVFPQQRIVNHLILDMPVRVSALRTLGAYANVFAIESFMDELAQAAKVDPVEFRLRHLTDPRARAVIEGVAEKAWKGTKASDGRRGRGIGFAQYKNLSVYVAAIADVEVDRQSGAVRVERVSAVCDGGMVINPNGFRNQIEGGIIQSASWTLREAIAYDKTKMLTRSWAKYPILRFPEVPDVDVTLIDRPDEKSLGVGEGAHGPTAAAIANAVANATGKRIRDLPLTPERVKAALG